MSAQSIPRLGPLTRLDGGISLIIIPALVKLLKWAYKDKSCREKKDNLLAI
jgi:hypothetical protein